jgi:hypothetical protein
MNLLPYANESEYGARLSAFQFRLRSIVEQTRLLKIAVGWRKCKAFANWVKFSDLQSIAQLKSELSAGQKA